MTLPVNERRVGPLTGGPNFPFDFKVFSKADVSVTLTTAAGVASTLVLDSDYSVALNGDQDSNPGGTVAYTLTVGDNVTILGSVTLSQGQSLPNGGGWFPKNVEDALDRLTMIAQQLNEKISRALLLPIATALSDIIMPSPSPGLFLRGNADGTGYENSAIVTSGAIGIPVPVVQGGSGATTAAGARTNFGLQSGATTIVGTAATKDVGVASGNVVQLDGSAKLPAVDGSQLVNLPPPATIIGAARDLFGRNNVATPNSLFDMSATELILKDLNGNSRTVALAATVNIAIPGGLSGCGNGGELSSQWYAIWAVDRTTPRVAVAVTATAATDRITDPAHGMLANQPVRIGGSAAPAGLTLGQTVYIRDVLTNDYKVAATPDGVAIDLTTTGTAVTVTTVPALMTEQSSAFPATLPASHTFKARIGGVYNDSGGNFLKTKIRDREIEFPLQAAINNGAVTTPGTLQLLDISAIVPAWATKVGGKLGRSDATSNSTLTVEVCGNVDRAGIQPWGAWNGAPTTPTDGFTGGAGPIVSLVLETAQTIYWTASAATAAVRIGINKIWH